MTRTSTTSARDWAGGIALLGIPSSLLIFWLGAGTATILCVIAFALSQAIAEKLYNVGETPVQYLHAQGLIGFLGMCGLVLHLLDLSAWVLMGISGVALVVYFLLSRGSS